MAAVTRLSPVSAGGALAALRASRAWSLAWTRAWSRILAASVVVLLAAGCGTGNFSETTKSGGAVPAPLRTSPKGVVHGGQQPVSGSTVQLWEVGKSGYGTGAALLGTAATTDAFGNFSLTSYSCSTTADGGNTLIYITASGGNPGLANNANNSALMMMATLGTCGSVTDSTFVDINEVTTVASVYSLAQFMSQSGGVGSYGASTQGLQNAFQTSSNLVDMGRGTALKSTLAGNGVVPAAKINTLANIIAGCINSDSPQSLPCTSLFQQATPPGGVAPTTTMGALLDIAQNPGNNVANLLTLPTPAAPFQPTISGATDLTLAIGYAGGGGAAQSLAIDGTGNVWVADYATGGTASALSLLSPTGAPASNSPYQNVNQTAGAYALAVDGNNSVWLANRDSNSAMQFTSTGSAGLTINPQGSALTSVGLNSPSGVGIDPGGNLWFTNNAGNSVVELAPTCADSACVTSYTGGGLSGPNGIALDSSGNAWISNTTGSSVTRIIPGTGPAADTGGGLTTPTGIALDGSTNVWVTDGSNPLLTKLNSNGAPLSSSAGYTGGGITASTAVAIDGAGMVWIASNAGNRLAEFTGGGTALTSVSGYQDASLSAPTSLGIDQSGNVWLADGQPVVQNGTTLNVTEFVGLATPTINPLAVAVKNGQLASTPGAPPQPKLPVANVAGPYSGVAGVLVSFNGMNSTDPKDQPLSYSWAFGDGASGSGPTPVHTYLISGTYTVTLTVTNTDGSQSTATASVTILAAAAPPPVVSTGGPYFGTAFTALSFNGLRSTDPVNPNGGTGALTYSWNFGDGSQGSGPTPVHTYVTSGSFTATLTVQSTATGATASATTSVTVGSGTATAGAPTANPGGPYSALAGATVTFNGSGSSDPNSLPLSYVWTFGDGGSATTQNPTYTYTTAGNYSVVVTVSNGTSSGVASTVAAITAPPPPAMVAKAGGPYTTPVNQPLQFSSAGTTDPTLRQLLYTWDFGDGSTSTGASPFHTYTRSGSYTVHLNVNDGASSQANAQAQVTVTGPAPEAITLVTGGPYQNSTGQPIGFSANSSSDNLGNPLSYTWNFGDGSTATGATATHTYPTVGRYTVTLSATSGTLSATTTTTAQITAPINVTITSPAAGTLFSTTNTTVTGTVSAPNLTVTVNGVTAQVNGTSFTASNVSLREGVNLITATAVDSNGGAGTGAVSVISDLTAPLLSITSPASNATVSASTITVTGLVSDSVTGTIGSNDVSITVNGQPAQISNRSYLLPNLQLVPGSNTITVVATDKVGNRSQTSETIQLLPATSQLSLLKVSGDGQSAAVKTVLGTPLVVQLVSAAGTPVAGRPVTFTVTRSDGLVEVLPTISQSISVTTDGNGKASALFQLGSRSGLGINIVSATTPGAAAPAIFTASSTNAPPARIVAVRGDNQRGLLGQSLAQSFQVMVQDGYGNPTPGVTVNFTSVGASDGTLDNPAPVSDGNGMAMANLTVGQQEGINNYAYTADFTGDTGNAVSFIASAYPQGPVSMTSVSGVVLDGSNIPVPNATVTIAGTSLRTVTNTSGNFSLTGAPVGSVTLTVDGSTATSTKTFPFLSFVLQDLPGQDNTLGKPIYLPAIDINDAQTVGGSSPVTLTMTGVPGLAFTVAPNSVTFPDGSTVGKLSLSQVKSDLVPMEPSNGTEPAVVWTLQPAGTKFSVPIQMTVPNTQALAPGVVTEIYQYDHDLEQFVSVGTGHVSADGSVINSDPGFGITKAGWSHCCTPSVKSICATSCNSYNPCVSIFAVPGCSCGSKFANEGGACQGTLPNQKQCVKPGTCKHGLCLATNLKDGTTCNGGDVCQTWACKGGACEGTAVPDVQQLPTATGSPGTLSLEASFDNLGGYLLTFFNKYKMPFTFVPTFNVSSQTVLQCCSATQTPSVANTTDTVTIGLKLTLPDVTPVLPTGTPLGITIPSWVPIFGGQKQGVTVAMAGAISGGVGMKIDNCANTVCGLGSLNTAITGGGQFNLGYLPPAGSSNPAVYAHADLTTGISGGITVGCGNVTGTLQWNGVTAAATFTAGPFAYSDTYVLIAPIAVPIPTATY